MDGTIEKAATLLPLANYVPHDTFPRDLARNLLLVDKISPTLKGRKDYIDVSAAFIKAASIPPVVFIELSWIASIPHITAKGTPNEPFILRQGYFEHESITQAHIDAFFHRSSITVQDLHEQSQHHDPLDVNFLALQRTHLSKSAPTHTSPLILASSLIKQGRHSTGHSTTQRRRQSGIHSSRSGLSFLSTTSAGCARRPTGVKEQSTPHPSSPTTTKRAISSSPKDHASL